MAKLYGEVPSSALMTFDKSFARANGQPLDSTEVYYSLSAAQEYAAGAGAYVGQKIVVIENDVVTHYSIEDEAGTLKELGSKPVGDNHSITVGDDGVVSIKDFGTGYYKYIPLEKNQDGTNKEGTGVYESELTQGFAENLTLKVKLAAGGGYEIAWYAPNTDTTEGVLDTVTGLTQSVETLNNSVGKVEGDVTDLQESIYGAGGTAETPAEGSIAANVNNLVDTVGKKDDVLGGSVNTLWANVNDLDSRVETIEADYLKSSDKKELQDAINAINVPVVGVNTNDKVLTLGEDGLLAATLGIEYDSEGKAIKLLGKNNTVLGTVDATPFIKDGMLHDVEYRPDTNELVFTWNTDAGESKTDTVVLSDIIEPYTAGNGLQLTGNEFSVKLAEGTEKYLTIDNNGIKLSGIDSAITTAKNEVVTSAAQDAQERADAAKKAAIDDAAAKYATTGALQQLSTDIDGRLDALEAHDHTTYSTKEELNAYKAEAANTYSTKEEVNALSGTVTTTSQKVDSLEDRIEEVAAIGGEPNIIEVIQVNGQAQTVTEKTVNIAVPTKFSDLTDDSGFSARIDAAQTQADKGVQDAAGALAAAQQAQTEVDALEVEVGNLQNTVASNTANIADHETRVADLEKADAAQDTLIAGLRTDVDGALASLETKASKTELSAAVGKIDANKAAIDELNDTIIPGINTEIAKKANTSEVYKKSEIDALLGEVPEGKTLTEIIAEAKTEATYDDTAIKNSIKENSDAIAILNGGADVPNSVLAIAKSEAETAAKAEVAKVVDSAPETMDTLKEVADWIANDESGAAAMANRITANEQAIAAITNSSTGILATANKYTDDTIAAMFESKKATNTEFGLIKGNVDGINIESGEVTSISTDLLVNGKKEFILYGGNSGASN